MINIFDTEPDFVNKIGVKFWIDKISTGYATKKGLDDVLVYYVETAIGNRTIIVTKKGQVRAECQRLEDVGAEIDKIVLLREFGGE